MQKSFITCRYVFLQIVDINGKQKYEIRINEWLINYSKRKNSTVTVKKKSCTKSVVFRYVQSVSETKTTQKRSDLLFNDFYFYSFNFYSGIDLTKRKSGMHFFEMQVETKKN